MSDENPFFAASSPIRENACYIEQSEKGFSLFARITLQQRVRVGVMNFNFEDNNGYQYVEGLLEDLNMHETVIDGQTIPTRHINRVTLLEEQNPFM